MSARFGKEGCSLLGVEDIPRERTGSYGIVSPEDPKADVTQIRAIVEKPAPKDAPFVRRAATGIGRFFGYTAGAMMFRVASAKADGASMMSRKGRIVGMPSSVLPRSLFRTMNAYVCVTGEAAGSVTVNS